MTVTGKRARHLWHVMADIDQAEHAGELTAVQAAHERGLALADAAAEEEQDRRDHD